MFDWLAAWLIGRWERRLSNRVTATTAGQPIMERWFVFRSKWLCVYGHKFLGSDENVLHDHPWWGLSIILRGSYVDVDARGELCLRPGDWLLRPPKRAHRIEMRSPEPCWTLFITGPHVREWGFHCPKGWRHWKDYNAGRLRCQDLE